MLKMPPLHNTIRSIRCYFLLALLIISSDSFAFDAFKANVAPVIDGRNTEEAWDKAKWQTIDALIVGEQPDAEDFKGRFKVVWTKQHLYILAEITDDVLIDSHSDPLDQYWEDDTLEIFIDEDGSGGDHLKNHSAFAYHVALDNQTADFGQDGKPRLYSDHITSAWQRSLETPNKVIWELEIKIFSDNYTDEPADAHKNAPVTLSSNKTLGFQVAYCDSDSALNGRESFIASNDVKAIDGDKNRAYIDASVFGKLTLKE